MSYPSDIPIEELSQFIIEQIEYDIAFRNAQTDFDKSLDLYEKKSGDTDQDGIPQENRVRRAVEDYLSVAIMNIPKASLRPIKDLYSYENMMERDLKTMVYDLTEKTINCYVNTILLESQYNDLLQTSLSDSAVFGVGYLKVDIDERANLRFDYELRDLLLKARNNEWTPEDAKRFKFLTKKIKVSWVDSRKVYWQHTVIRADDEQMQRVSIVDIYTTQSLKRKWSNNPYSDEDDIKAGEWPNFVRPRKIEEQATGTPEGEEVSAEVTTYWLEPYELKEKLTFFNELGDEEEIEIPQVEAYRLVKTVLAGGALVYHEVMDFDEAVGRHLPIVPFYLRESKNHPYGFSIPLMLELSQTFINLMRAIMFKSAKKAVSNQGVIVAIPEMGVGDEAEIDRILEEGGVAKLRFNNIQGPTDIRNMVMPVNYVQSPIQPSVLQAWQMEANTFDQQAQTLNLDAVASARSGSAKRAQAQVNDRPKTISVSLLSRAIENVYDLIYEYIRTHHKDRAKINIRLDGGARETVYLNDPYSMKIPYMDANGQLFPDPFNPEEPFMMETSFKLNDTGLIFIAESEGRGDIPLDPIQRLQYATLLKQNQFITPSFARDIVLNADMMAKDDMYKEKEKKEQMEQMQQMMQLQQQQMAAQQGGIGLPQLPTSGSNMNGLGISQQENATDATQI